MRLLWRRRTANERDRELIWLAVSAAAIAGGVAWLALALPWPRCPFFAATGLPCVTCGATRSVVAFLHGDFFSALRWNPLAAVVFCALIIFDLYALVVIAGRTARLRIVDWTVTEKKAARIVVIGLLALNWIYLLAHHDRF